jgi:hypothetical protein
VDDILNLNKHAAFAGKSQIMQGSGTENVSVEGCLMLNASVPMWRRKTVEATQESFGKALAPSLQISCTFYNAEANAEKVS